MDDKRLEEYKIADAKTQKLDDQVWKTFSIIGVIAISPLVALIAAGLKEISFVFVSYLGAGLVWVTFIWWGIAKRWWDIQHTYFGRMRELEKQLGFKLTLDVDRRDGTVPGFAWKGVEKSLSFFLLAVTTVWIAVSYLTYVGANGKPPIRDIWQWGVKSVVFWVLLVELVFAVGVSGSHWCKGMRNLCNARRSSTARLARKAHSKMRGEWPRGAVVGAIIGIGVGILLGWWLL